MKNEKMIIEYVRYMLLHHSTATLDTRLELLLDVLEAVPSYCHDEIIAAACRIPEEAEQDAEL